MDSFREHALASGGTQQFGGIFGWGGRRGSSPAPFDAVDATRLAGPSGSHPLAAVSMDELVRRSTDGLDGEMVIREPVRIGEGIAGRLSVTARRDIRARGAMIRLVGVRLSEQQRSRDQHDTQGRVTSSEQWVEVDGDRFEHLPFSEPPLPASLAAGERVDVDFNLPAPRLGPPSGHLGSAIIAWAVDARWDIAMGGDESVAALVDVRQNIDYLRSGAVRLAAGALYDAWQVGDATIAVSPLPPAVAGSVIDVTVTWPGASSGRGARLELQADVDAPNGISKLVVWSTPVDPAALRQGLTVRMPIPADAPPTMAARNVGVSYRIRALVDRHLRSDLAVERAIAVM
jgi:hypothetical protein